ncbi:MAG: methyltransferase domain-containing protein [Deltaproteobacteria bacterium]|nr:methyltransferase domain-containing protein [Deltaproteobacteria bacterium]
MNDLDIIVCGKCRGDLAELGNAVKCTACGEAYHASDGFYRLEEGKYYWGEIPQGRMTEINSMARKEGWRKAVAEMARGGLLPEESVCGRSRANFRFHLPIPHDSRVVDIGSGWGAIPFLLADVYSDVWSLEYINERVEFQTIRKAQEGRENLRVVQSSLYGLPFRDESFDLVVMNGVLEWAGLSFLEKNPRDVQLEVLRDVLRILKKGGILYVGIENRIGYGFFLGRKDHTGLPFTSLLPRFAADMVMRIRKKDIWRTGHGSASYRTYTYSPDGYRRLFRDAGFESTEIFWVLPSYNQPVASAPADDTRMIEAYLSVLKPGSPKKEAALKIFRELCRRGFMKWFSSDLLMYSKKGS